MKFEFCYIVAHVTKRPRNLNSHQYIMLTLMWLKCTRNILIKILITQFYYYIILSNYFLKFFSVISETQINVILYENNDEKKL